MKLIRRALGQRVCIIDSYKAGIPYARLSVENNVRVLMANGYGGIMDISTKRVTAWKGVCYIHEHTWGVGCE